VLTADVVLPAAALLFTELLLMGWVETKRWQDFRNPGSQGDGSFLGITDGFKGKGNGYPGVCQYKLDCSVESWRRFGCCLSGAQSQLRTCSLLTTSSWLTAHVLSNCRRSV